MNKEKNNNETCWNKIVKRANVLKDISKDFLKNHNDKISNLVAVICLFVSVTVLYKLQMKLKKLAIFLIK